MITNRESKKSNEYNNLRSIERRRPGTITNYLVEDYLKVRRPVNKTPKNKRLVPNFRTPKVRLILKEHKLD